MIWLRRNDGKSSIADKRRTDPGLKKIEPDTDVFLKKSKVQIRPMEWNSLKPGILWI